MNKMYLNNNELNLLRPRLLRLLWFLVVCAGLVGGCRDGSKGAEAHLVVPLTTGPIQIDGSLDEEAWQGAARTGFFRTTNGKQAARLRTEARLTWDQENLYFGFECEDEDIFSSYTRRDQPLYLQEAVEVFLDPDGDRRDYMEFEVSPAGVLFDASFTARREGLKLNFNPDIQVSVKIDGTLNTRNDQDRGWVVEMAIPFSQMTGRGRRPPAPGDQWLMNMYRLDKSGQGGEASSFLPTPGDFHDLSSFGIMRFSK
jgi:hypothetical protein